ncbi:hypothetical protein A671_02454 [Salmonella enterica subsp. enterica serovar Dublin str. DG22]|uniref:Uncharacterized protein n=1 Tax=Salmonella enterica subsp. enterica serovar Dublin str. UC16 TaxID=1192688 RepID=M7RK01_SALDU|nr:hypothetical protein A670_02779 [Salmonella enterica subsp. enterica serovar Dublin str. UC16]EPI69883.1 hypothetical protein A671_02454 [Salmonella enterica subsp. enterica serovar Dublin str. DG22]
MDRGYQPSGVAPAILPGYALCSRHVPAEIYPSIRWSASCVKSGGVRGKLSLRKSSHDEFSGELHDKQRSAF